jgi:hypothetical protein
MGKRREMDSEVRRGPQGWWTRGFLGRSDWEVVRLGPVLAEKGWQEYFAPKEETPAAA